MKTVIETSTGKALYLFPDSAIVTLDDKGLVALDIRALDIKPETHSVIENVPAPLTWAGGAIKWDGVTWVTLDVARLEEVVEEQKKKAISRINIDYSNEMAEIVAEYPETERESWGKQEKEAKEWVIDNTVPTPFMDAILSVRTNVTKMDLATKIITKANALADITGQLTGKRHNLVSAIKKATTVADIEDISW